MWRSGGRTRRCGLDARGVVLVVLSLFALALAACADGGSGVAIDAGDTSTRARSTSSAQDDRCEPGTDPLASGVFDHAGVERAYNVTFPSRAGPFPVVLNLHGVSGTKDVQDAATGLPEAGVDRGFVTVTPETAPGEKQWSLDPAGDDVAYLLALLDRAAASPCADAEQTYVAGFSNGGMMAALLGCLHADRVAAIGAVGGLVALAPCAGTNPAPLLAIHGTADRSVGYDGTMAARVVPLVGYAQGPDVETLTRDWAGRRGCADPPTTATWGDVQRTAHCDDAELVAIAGEGHGWPVRSSGSPVDANQLLWQFFEPRSLGS